MKKLFLVFIMSIFLLTLVSAAEWDNVGQYDSETKSMYIKNALGYGDVEAVIHLDTPLSFKVARGYQKVAQYTIVSLKDYKDPIKELELFNIKQGMNPISIDVDYKFLTSEDVNVSDYEYECDKHEAWETKYKCKQIMIGWHFEEKEKWTNLNKEELKKNGLKEDSVLTIGIWRDVKPNESIEWIPNLFGVRISEWASWTEDLNTNLTYYYKLNESSGSTSYDSLGNLNLTVNGATVGEDGKINNSVYFDGVNDYLQGNSHSIAANNFTISQWYFVNSSEANVYMTFPSITNVPTPGGFGLGGSGSTHDVWFSVGNPGWGAHNPPIATMNNKEWIHVVGTYGDDNASIYINGVYNGSTDAMPSDPYSGGNLYMGTRGDKYNYFNGSIDEVGIWNRVLTPSEISDLYNSGDGITYGQDATLSIEITSPENKTYSTTSIDLNISNSTALSTCYRSLNGASNISFTPNSSITATEGANNVSVWCNDTDGNNDSNIQFFTVDTTSPNVTIIVPADGETYNQTNQTLNITATDLLGIDTIIYNWNGTNYTYSETGSGNTTDESWVRIKANNYGTGYSSNSAPENITTPTKNFTANTGGNGPVKIYEDIVLFATGTSGTGGIYINNRSNISQNLHYYDIGNYCFGSPLIANASDGGTYIYAACGDGYAYRWNMTLGLLESYNIGATVSKEGIVVNGSFIIGSHVDNTLYQFNDTNVSQLLNSKNLGGAVLGTPSISFDQNWILVGAGGNLNKLNVTNVSISGGSIACGGNCYRTATTGDNATYGDFVWQSNDAGRDVVQIYISNMTSKATHDTGGATHTPGSLANGYFFQQSQGGDITMLNALTMTEIDAVNLGDMTEPCTASDTHIFCAVRSPVYDIVALKYNSTGLYEDSRFDNNNGMDTSLSFANGKGYIIGASGVLYEFGESGSSGPLYGPIINFSEGSNTLKVWTNDTLGNVNYTDSTFTIDTSITRIINTMLYPSNNLNQTNRNIDFLWNVTPSDDLLVINSSLWIDDLLIMTNDSGFAGNYTFNNYILNNTASHTWKIVSIGNDSVQYNSSERTFSVSMFGFNVTSISPVANHNSTSSTISFDCSSNDSYEVINMSLIINDTNYENVTASSADMILQSNESLADGTYEWYCEATTSLGTRVTQTRNLFVDINKPAITLTSPIETYSTLNNGDTLNLNWTVVDSNLDSCWYDYLGLYSGIPDETTFTGAFVDGDWATPQGWTTGNMTHYNTYNDSTANWTLKYFFGSNMAISPINVSYSLDSCIAQDNEQLEFVFSDNGTHYIIECNTVEIEVIKYSGMFCTGNCAALQYEQLVSWNDGIVNCSDNHTTFNYSSGFNNLTFYANDTYGNIANQTTSWELIWRELGQTFDTNVVETTEETFSMNITYNSVDWISMIPYLNYGGVTYVGTSSGTGDEIVVTKDIYIPEIDIEGNRTLNWTISLINSTGTFNFTSTSNVQYVTKVNFSNCLYEDNPQLFFKTYSVSYPDTLLNATFSSAWTIRNAAGGDIVLSRSFEDLSESNSSWGFCLEPNSTNYTLSVDINVDASEYTPASYYIVDTDFAGSGENISLYLLNDSLATLTEIKVVDKDNVVVENVYVTIQRYDLGTDTYYNVDMARTDSLGSDLVYLTWYDEWYRFIGVLDGEVVFNSGAQKVSSTPLIFKTGGEDSSDYEKFRGILYGLTFENTTDNFVLTFIDPTGEVSSSCLRVIKRNVTADYIICETCEESSSATIYCNIGAHGNGTFIANYYATGSPRYYIDQLVYLKNLQNEIYDLLGNDNGTGMAILAAWVVLGFFLISPALGILGAMLGMVMAVAMGFQPLDYTAFIGIIVVGAIMMWAVKK